jgi:hypothetical protein
LINGNPSALPHPSATPILPYGQYVKEANEQTSVFLKEALERSQFDFAAAGFSFDNRL